MRAGRMDAVDGTPRDKAERIGAQLIGTVGVRVEDAIKQLAAAAHAARADRDDIVAGQRRAVRLKNQRSRIAEFGGIEFVDVVTDGGIQPRIHRVLQTVEDAHMQNRQRRSLLPAPFAQAGDRVIGAGIIHNHQLILGKMGFQLRRRGAAEFHRTGTVVVQVDHGGDKVFFLVIYTTHSSSTSSKS